VLLSWFHWSPGALALSVAVLLLVAGPQVVLLVVLPVVTLLVALLVVQAAPGLLLAVGLLVAPVPVLGKLVVLGPAAAVALVVAFVAGPTEAFLECFH
jgi:hypothetical protein